MTEFLTSVISSIGYATNVARQALRKPNFISEMFKWLLVSNPQTRRPELWERIEGSDVDLNKLFKGLAGKRVMGLQYKPDPEDLEDMIQDVLMQVVTKKTIEDWDGTSDPIKYFGGMFSMRMINQVRDWVTRKTREQQEGGSYDDDERGTREEELDRLDTRKDLHNDPLEGYVQTEDLLKGLQQHFKTKPANQQEWLEPLVFDLIEGKSLTDIANELGVSKTIMSRRLDYLGQYMAEYAQKTGNELLKQLLQKYIFSRKHYASGEDEAFTNLFDDYDDKKLSADTDILDAIHFDEGVYTSVAPDIPAEDWPPKARLREPSGTVSRITKKTIADPYNRDKLALTLMDSSTALESLQAAVSDSVDDLFQYSDLVEDEQGNLSALVAEEITNNIPTLPNNIFK